MERSSAVVVSLHASSALENAQAHREMQQAAIFLLFILKQLL